MRPAALSTAAVAAALSLACASKPAGVPEGVAVTVRPPSVQTSAGAPVPFAATVTGTADLRVTWHLQETGTGATLSDAGLFSAPAAGFFHVVARSVADPTRSGSATVTVVDGALGADVLPGRRTVWRPGIPSDGQLGLPLGDDGLPRRSDVCTTVPTGGDIQAAVDGCAEGRVVQLSPGTYTVSSTVVLAKGLVLRGAGSEGAPTGTTIVKTGGGSVLAIGTERDGACYAAAMTAYSLTADAPQEATSVTVSAASAASFHAGDLALVDAVDGAGIDEGDCTFFKRVDHRSASQRVEIVASDPATGRLTLGTPLHWAFPAGAPSLGQISRANGATTRWAGVEHLRVQGGTNRSYPGAEAGGIDVSNAAYCWVKDVQTDGTIGGMHVSLTGTYRCVVRDSVFHHSASYGFGADCYGIVLRCGAADNLVENNVVRYMNKPILFNATGGGNVVAYNYADNSWADPPEWQEVNIDTHCSFPHMELVEGNWAPHVGATSTHGNAGFLTFFRNYSSARFAAPAVFGHDVTQTGNVAAVQLDVGMTSMNVLGSVLGEAGWTSVYDGHDPATRAVFLTAGATDVGFTTLFRHGNWDAVHGGVVWDPGTAVTALPPSLFRGAVPAWWPAGTPWPWTGPDLSPRVGTLPAKQRSDALGL